MISVRASEKTELESLAGLIGLLGLATRNSVVIQNFHELITIFTDGLDRVLEAFNTVLGRVNLVGNYYYYLLLDRSIYLYHSGT